MVPGDVLIGGVFNVHGANEESPFKCGGIKLADGYQHAEALVFALESIKQV